MLKSVHHGHHFHADDSDATQDTISNNSASDPENGKINSGSKTKDFWHNVVKPAFPEAITDIKLIKSAIKIQSSSKADMKNTHQHPEAANIATVRRGLSLAPEETQFLTQRKLKVRAAFAKYLDLNIEDVHPDDVPIIGFGGSGGGFRAMIAVLGYSAAMKKSGLWDLLTYVAGVSGACWALASYYTFGEASMTRVINNYKARLSPHHPLSGEAIRKLLTTKDGAYATLAPVAIKRHSGLHAVPMDYYSVFLTGYVFIHADHETGEDVAGHRSTWFKWSQAIEHLSSGDEPLPMLTAIRHERPWKDWVDKAHAFSENHYADEEVEKKDSEKDAWFQWFEFTPYEIGCDELQAWCPTWGFGRPFENGQSIMSLPEQSLSLLLGLATGAPAGPLESYLSTIQRSLPQNFLGHGLNSAASKISHLWGKKNTEEFTNHHPLHASNEHNFLFHYTKLREGEVREKGIENSPRIHLVDAGMDNNCPTYVLLRPERECDVVLNLDASSDVQKGTFEQRVNQIGARRGLKFEKQTPSNTTTNTDPDSNPSPDGNEKDKDKFHGQYTQHYTSRLIPRPSTITDSYGNTVTNPPVGSVCEKEVDMLYLPLLPNEKVVKGFDPSTAKWSGSYNLVWSGEQIEMLVGLCEGNFAEGEEVVRGVLRGAWVRKKRDRLAREAEGSGVV